MNEMDRAKQGSLGHLLLRTSRLYNEACVARIAKIYPGLSVAHTTLLPHLEFDRGVRPTELAKRVGVSKQAVNQLLNDLEARGLLARHPDPQDRRARLVQFTDLGQEAVLSGLGVLKQLEDELSKQLDLALVSRLKSDLLEVQRALERRP